MFNSIDKEIEQNRIIKYKITRSGATLAYADVIELWQTDSSFRSYFAALLADAPFSGFRWETPPINHAHSKRPFEFVLINAPKLNSRSTDQFTYANYFTKDSSNEGIVTFDNLSGDAMLVVPSPRSKDSAYGHIAAFVRKAPTSQVDALWRIVGQTLADKLDNSPIWLNTAGGGVAWLHIRLDSRPKYYGYTPYKLHIS